MKTFLGWALALGLSASASLPAAELSKTNTPLYQILARVPAAELPAQAAELVKVAPARDLGFVTVDVVRAALTINSPAAPAVVAAIARPMPEMASIAAGTAVELLPKKASEIAKAATGAAPSRAGKIVSSVCRAVPGERRAVALAAAQAAPGASTEILRALASAFPDLRPGIDKALAVYGGSPPPVPVVLNTIQPTPPPTGPAPGSSLPPGYSVPGVRRISIAPPEITTLNPTNSGVLDPGRDYARP